MFFSKRHNFLARFLLISGLALAAAPIFSESTGATDFQMSPSLRGEELLSDEIQSIHQGEVDLILAEGIFYSEAERNSDFPDLDFILTEKRETKKIISDSSSPVEDEKNKAAEISVSKREAGDCSTQFSQNQSEENFSDSVLQSYRAVAIFSPQSKMMGLFFARSSGNFSDLRPFGMGVNCTLFEGGIFSWIGFTSEKSGDRCASGRAFRRGVTVDGVRVESGEGSSCGSLRNIAVIPAAGNPPTVASAPVLTEGSGREGRSSSASEGDNAEAGLELSIELAKYLQGEWLLPAGNADLETAAADSAFSNGRQAGVGVSERVGSITVPQYIFLSFPEPIKS